MTNKELYKKLCSEEKNIPLFLQHWWMDIVSQDKQWDVIFAYKNNQIIAAMPYLINSKFGMRYIIQPQLTQFNGIWINYPDNLSEYDKLSIEKKIYTEIISNIESLKLSYFDQNFSPQITNWLPFYWNGYKQTTRYTYHINLEDDLDKIYNNIEYNKQKQIKKQEKQNLSVRFDIDANTLYNLQELQLKSRGKKNTQYKDFVIKICENAIERNCGFIVGIENENRNLCAALFIATDNISAYCLISAIHPDYRNNGASSIMFWEAIKKTKQKNLHFFDFEGSMQRNIEKSFAAFGAKQVPYFNIYKSNCILFDLIRKIKHL